MLVPVARTAVQLLRYKLLRAYFIGHLFLQLSSGYGVARGVLNEVRVCGCSDKSVPLLLFYKLLKLGPRL